MSFVSIVRDYVETLNHISDSFGTDLTFKTFLLETFSYILQTIKYTIFYILSFQWVRDFTLLPTVIPAISSSIFKETLFLETPSKIFFEFLEIPSLDLNKFILGFFNSFFFTLPISIIHIIAIRRLLIQGIPAGVFTISGYLLGQFFFLTSVIFGIRVILVPWLTLEPLNYILGLILIFRIIYPMVRETLMPISGWDWKKPKYQNFFLTSFALAWCEQGAIFQYLGNVSITSNPTLLEGFSTNSPILSLLSHVNYLVGIFCGSIIFTLGWGFLFYKLPDFVVKYTSLLKSSFMQKLNTATFVLSLAFTISSIPYYGVDYLLTGPLGFVSKDQIFHNTLLSQYTLPDSVKNLGSFSFFQTLEIDVAPFDRGRYLIFPTNPYQSFEDINYKGEFDWTTRVDKLTSIAHPNAKRISRWIHTKKRPRVDEPLEGDAIEKLNYLIKEDPAEVLYSLGLNPDREMRFSNWYIRQFPHTPIIDKLFEIFTTESFPDDFLRKNSIVEANVEKKLKQKYYSNPVYKNLLALDIDLFLNREPKQFKLNTKQEFDLYQKRIKLNSYLNSLRSYSKLTQSEEFNKFFHGTKSFSNKVYNQQFKGTLRSVRRLFALTPTNLDSKKLSNSQNQLPVLKFDQPLYEFLDHEKFSPYHEELSETQNFSSRSPLSNYVLKDTLTRPLYAGWDANLRKFVITNKLLERKVAGYQMKLPAQLSKKFSSSTQKTTSPLGSQKIKFTVWPLPEKYLNQSRFTTKIPYTTLYFNEHQFEDVESSSYRVYLPEIPSIPGNLEALERDDLSKEFLAKENILANRFDFLAPKRGGFVWPGNPLPKFMHLVRSPS